MTDQRGMLIVLAKRGEHNGGWVSPRELAGLIDDPSAASDGAYQGLRRLWQKKLLDRRAVPPSDPRLRRPTHQYRINDAGRAALTLFRD